MKKLFLLPIMALALVACTKSGNTPNEPGGMNFRIDSTDHYYSYDGSEGLKLNSRLTYRYDNNCNANHREMKFYWEDQNIFHTAHIDEWTYNNNHQMLTEKRGHNNSPEATGIEIRWQNFIEYTYDSKNRLTNIVDTYDPYGPDKYIREEKYIITETADGYTRKMEGSDYVETYNKNNQLISSVTDTWKSEYTYNANGLKETLKSYSKLASATTWTLVSYGNYTYKDNMPLLEEWFNGENKLTSKTEYVYDNGSLVRINDYSLQESGQLELIGYQKVYGEKTKEPYYTPDM